jgi:hypothetical protein
MEGVCTCELLKFEHFFCEVPRAAAGLAGVTDLEGCPDDVNSSTLILSLGKEPVSHANKPHELFMPVLICNSMTLLRGIILESAVLMCGTLDK